MVNLGFDISIESIRIYLNEISGCDYTIAIPTFKRSFLLKKTLESVFTQENDATSFNVIVVDNNPERNDDTEKLMEQYRDRKNVSYFKNSENLGMIGNWNRCFLLSQTKYVVLLHDDDLLEPDFFNYILRAVSKLTYKPFAIIKPCENRWKDDGIPYVFHHYQGKLEMEKIIAIENYDGFKLGAPTGCLFNREIVLNMGGFDESYKQAAADLEFFIRLNQSYKCYQIKCPLLVYRISANESLKVEIQYVGYELCYSIIRRLVNKYMIPDFLFNRYWSYYSEGWASWIEKQFNIIFDLEEAYKRIALPQYSTIEKRVSDLLIKIYVRLIILPLNGKIKLPHLINKD